MQKTNSTSALLRAVLLTAVLYVCFFSGLGVFGLIGPDEPRYAAIAREMAASGDWVTPRLFGQPWFEKPVLYYWTAALAYRSGLTDEKAARLPSGIFALLATLGAAWAARRFYGQGTALEVLLLLPTSAAMIGFAHAAATDMPFAACLTLAMVAATQVLWPEKRARQEGALQTAPLETPDEQASPIHIWAIAWGVCLGLATLAKGPAALALAAGSVALWGLVTRRWRVSMRLFHPAGIAAFCATALPWYALCAERNPTFLRIFLLEHNLERFATNRYQHVQPFWFFAPVLLLAIFPWTFLLGACVTDAFRVFREKRQGDSPGLFFACWAVFPFLFFSISQSKLPGYILPCVPALILLVTRSITRLIEANDPLTRAWMARVVLAFLLLAGAAMVWLRTLSVDQAAVRAEVPMLAVAAVALGLLVAMLSTARRAREALWAAAISVAALVAGAEWRLLPAMDAQISPRTEARAAIGETSAKNNIAIFELPRAWEYGLNYYAGRELPEWTPQAARPVWVLTTDGAMIDLWRLGVRPREVGRFSRRARILEIQ